MANAKKAFITGISGQDGSYLTEFLLDKVMDFIRSNRDVQVLDYQMQIL